MTPGSLDIGGQVKSAISTMISKSGKSRWAIIAEINGLANTDFQKSTLDGWSAESRGDSNAPVKILPALIMSTQQFDLIDLVGKSCGCQMLRGSESILAEVARIESTQKKLDEEKSKLQELYLRISK